jgi:phage terminase large subunit-like protein
MLSEIEASKFGHSPDIEELLLRTDLSYFAEQILDMEISGHHEEWSELVAKNKKLCINAPRDHGKSFMFSFAYVIWRLYYNWIPSSLTGEQYKSIPRVSVGYIFSNTQDQAVNLLELVKREIESNPRLEHLIPASKEVWSKTALKLSNGAICRARGWNQSVRGAHPVWIVCDDVLTDEAIYSEMTRMKQIDYFFSAVTPMLVPGGQLIVVGTPFHQDDLYAKLRENKAYNFCRFPALSDIGAQPLWPTRYSKAQLVERKEEVGSTRFAREYLCLPISDDSSLFPERILTQCYDPSFEMPINLTQEDREQLRIFTGVDLALSSTVGADYTVITTLAVDKFQNRWIIDIRRKKGLSMNEQLREIQDVYKTYRPLNILVENNAFQRVFVDELVGRTDLPVNGHTTTAHNKNQFETGVPSMQILFENRKFVIPRKTERDREITDKLINELKCFTWQDGKLQGLGAHDDMVMSLWIANCAVNSHQFTYDFVG